MKKRFIIAIVLLLSFMIQVSRFHQISAYFNSRDHLTFNFKIGDWIAPELKLTHSSESRTTVIQEKIHNGTFDQAGEGWIQSGNVTFIHIDNTNLGTVASRAAVLRSSAGSASTIRQLIQPQDNQYLQFFLKVESEEEIFQFLEHSIQVLAHDTVIYDWQSSREELSDWHDIRVRMPDLPTDTELEFKVNPLTSITKPITVSITGVSTHTIGLNQNHSLRFESNEQNTTICFFEMQSEQPFECQLLPLDKHYPSTEKKNYKVTLTDAANQTSNYIFSYQTDFIRPQTTEFLTPYLENDNELTIKCLINTGTEERLYQTVGFSDQETGEYVWTTELYDWQTEWQLSNSKNNLVSLNDICQTKIVKNIPSTATWLKIRTYDFVGNEADISYPYRIRD